MDERKQNIYAWRTYPYPLPLSAPAHRFLMAFSARHVSPHDARSPQTGTVLIHWLGSLRAAADSKAHLPPFSPGP